MIVSGDFNINFYNESLQPLIYFFLDILHLNIINHQS